MLVIVETWLHICAMDEICQSSRLHETRHSRPTGPTVRSVWRLIIAAPQSKTSTAVLDDLN